MPFTTPNILLWLLLLNSVIFMMIGITINDIIKKMRMNPKIAGMAMFNQGKVSFVMMGLGMIIYAASSFLALLYAHQYFVYSMISLLGTLIACIPVYYGVRILRNAVNYANLTG